MKFKDPLFSAKRIEPQPNPKSKVEITNKIAVK